MELDTIFNQDCLVGLKALPDKAVDLILTDPPYGKKADKGTNGFGAAKNRRYTGGWDGMIPPPELFKEMFRVAKNLIIFGGNYFGHLLPPSNCWIFWDKKGDVAFQNPFADGELIYTTFKKPVKRIVFKQQGFITDSKGHFILAGRNGGEVPGAVFGSVFHVLPQTFQVNRTVDLVKVDCHCKYLH